MGLQPGQAGDVRARAVFGHRPIALTARAAVVLIAFYVTLRYLVPGDDITSSGFDAQISATITGAILVAACGLLALLVRRNRLIKAKLARLEDRLEELSDRDWELKEAAERNRSFLEALGDVIVRRDAEGRIADANDAFCRLTGQPIAALRGAIVAPQVIEQGEIAALPDGTRVHDQRIATPEGPRWIAWREAALRGAASAPETLAVGRDVTDRVAAEHALADARDAAETANRAKGRFLAMVSHEIRTPLNGILGMADLLLDTALAPEQATYAKAVKTSGDTLLSLIEEVLDFSKIEAGRLDLEARPFALSTLIEETIELIAPRAQGKGLEIASYVDERLPARVTGDAARLRQVLLNLAGNAVKFTETGGVAILIEPGIWPDEITFRVADTGIGIAPEAQARIFQEFEQADSSSTRRFGGTGLGLAISRSIVERMGGSISLDSATGQGSTFHFTVTLPRATDRAETPFAAPDLTGASVLVVSSSAIEAPLIMRRLGRWGARTALVPNETAAQALIPERAWDAILVDRAIGAEAARSLAGARDIPRRIVLITPAERHEEPALDGFTGYLVKPVRAISLAARFLDAPGAPARDDDFGPDEEPASDILMPKPKGLAILVAEDNDINALLARALLTRLGHRPTIAANGAAAVESWHAARTAGAPYDLVLMDVHMPEVDGIEATRRIRAAESELGASRTPVVALTANAFGEDREACLAAGMDGLLVKPLDRERLAEALASARPRAPLAA